MNEDRPKNEFIGVSGTRTLGSLRRGDPIETRNAALVTLQHR